MAVALRRRPSTGRVVPGAPRAGRSRAVFPNPVILAEIGWARQLAARLPLMALRPTENTDFQLFTVLSVAFSVSVVNHAQATTNDPAAC